MGLEKGSDQRYQLIATLYMLSIYPSVHNLLFRSFLTFFEAHIVVQILQAVNNYFMLGDGAIYVSILILLAIATLFTVAGHQKTTFLSFE